MINILPNIIFSILLITSVGFFIYNIKKLITVIKLGKPIDRTDNPKKRLSNMGVDKGNVPKPRNTVD